MKFPLALVTVVFVVGLSQLAKATIVPPVPNPPKFLVPPTAGTSAAPVQSVAADFNGDGFIDLAVTSSMGVDVFLGNGDGTFKPKVTYPVRGSRGANAITLADMNNDGALDLIVTQISGPAAVQILLGNGDGTFNPARSFSTIGSAVALAVGDFNNDGNLDVAVAQSEKSIGVFLGNGDGTLQPGFNYAVVGNGHTNSIAVGDFSGDGNIDIVTTANSLEIFKGNGDGTFQPAQELLKSAGANQVVAWDVNGDGESDLVVSDAKGIAVLLNHNGQFGQQIISPTGALNGIFTLGDFNGDGKIDIAMSGLGILLGNGTGHFKIPAAIYSDGGFSGNLVGADLNGDGNLDLVQVSTLFNDLVLYIGNGNGTLHAPQSFATDGGTSALAIAAGDFNQDGKLDLAVLDNSHISILLGIGNGTFQPTVLNLDTTANKGIIVADFNNDGKLDIADLDYANGKTGSVEVFLGNGDGTFQSPLTFDVGYESVAFAAGDFNRDGNLDLAVVDVCINNVNCQNGVASIFLGNGDGSFQAGKVIYVGASPNSIGVADFNGDSIVDLVVANSGKGRTDAGGVSFLAGVGDGSFLPSVPIKASTKPANLIVADFNGDGLQDVAVNNGTSISVIFGEGNGMFAFPVTNPGAFGGSMTAADFNGDRKLDIAITQNAVQVLTGLGNGKFEAPVSLLENSGSIVVLPALLGNDVLPDLVVGTELARPVTVVVNQTH
jgi:hypothetical protein